MPHSNQPKKLSAMEQIDVWPDRNSYAVAALALLRLMSTIFLYIYVHVLLAFLSARDRQTYSESMCRFFLYGGAYGHIAQLKDFYDSFEDVKTAFNSRTLNEFTYLFMCNFWRCVSSRIRVYSSYSCKKNDHSFLLWQKSWTQFSFFRMVKRSYWFIAKHFFQQICW